MSDTTLKIPEGWFVCGCDLDAANPWCVIAPGSHLRSSEPERKLLIPQELAEYLSKHFCGSRKMEKLIEKNTKHEIRSAIFTALGISDTPLGIELE